MECYFDNAATTAVGQEVKDLMWELLDVDFGNPSSQHPVGLRAVERLRTATAQLAKALKCGKKEVVFTSGGTEANNLALIGGAMAKRRAGKHIIISAVEHASVSSCAKALEKEGFEISYLPVDGQGRVILTALPEFLREDTILVSCMYVNNEMGAIQPVEELVKQVKDYNPEILVHVDAVQAFGKIRFSAKALGADLLSVSAHKIQGPKGVGALYIKEKTLIRPLIYGGGQQQFLRSGTENVSGICGFGLAAELCMERLEETMSHVKGLKEHFLLEVTKLDGVFDHSGEAGHIASVSFEGLRAAVLMRALGERQIYVSAGSACSSNKPQVSHVLKAMNLPAEHLESTLRFSFNRENTTEQIDYCLGVLRELLPMLRKYTRK